MDHERVTSVVSAVMNERHIDFDEFPEGPDCTRDIVARRMVAQKAKESGLCFPNVQGAVHYEVFAGHLVAWGRVTAYLPAKRPWYERLWRLLVRR